MPYQPGLIEHRPGFVISLLKAVSRHVGVDSWAELVGTWAELVGQVRGPSWSWAELTRICPIGERWF
jgi:hypothetical protein